MNKDLEFTGERFLPGAPGAIAYEHWHRYAFALRFVRGRSVLDAACGEGYGTALLAGAAARAIGIDIDGESVRHAKTTYADISNLSFEPASVTSLPLADASVDVVVSFETIEHLPALDQPQMLAEFARVLTDDGVLVLSSPNRRRYSDARNYHNPFHLHELYRDELARLLDRAFAHRRWFHQAPLLASALWAEGSGVEPSAGGAEAWSGDGHTVTPAFAPDGIYYLVVGTKSEAALPEPEPHLSVFTDGGASELARVEAAAAEVLRLDELLRQRNDASTRDAQHVRHLEELLALHRRTVEERDAQLVACNGVRQTFETALIACRLELSTTQRARTESQEAVARLETRVQALTEEQRTLEASRRTWEEEKRNSDTALAAQERIIRYRGSLRWWLELPWLRAHLWWQRRLGR